MTSERGIMSLEQQDSRSGRRAGSDAVSSQRLLAAMLIAIAADSVGAIPGELLPVVFDVAVALTLALVVGPRPVLLGALLLEAIPVVGMFPSWIAAVAYVTAQTRQSDRH